MSGTCLKRPSRPPPPPPIEYPSSSSSSSPSFNNLRRRSSNRSTRKSTNSDYIKISDCHTGLPERPPKPLGLIKSRTSTSFSSSSTSTLKPPTSSNFLHSKLSHQKSRSLTTDSHLAGSSYLYLDLPSSLHSSSLSSSKPNNQTAHNASTVYKTVDFLKTEALNRCKEERTSGSRT